MDSLKEDKGKLKTPWSTSTGCSSVRSDQSMENPLGFQRKHVKKSGSTSSVCETEMSSVDVPLHLRKQRTPPLSSGCLSVRSGQSMENPLSFKSKHVKKPGSIYSACETAKASMDIPLHFRQQGKRPDSEYFAYETDFSSTDSCGNETEEGVVCDICGQAAAVKICLTCNISYCEYDVRQHYTVEALQRHILKDVCGEAEEKRCLHFQRSLDFFCRTDQIPVCSICVQRNHRGHDVVFQRAESAASQTSSGKEYKHISRPSKVVPPPGKIEFLLVESNSVVLSWGLPKGLKGRQSFQLKWSSLKREEGSLVIKDFTKIEINNLQLGQKYFFSVATEDEDGNLSERITASVFTAVPPPRHLTKGHAEATAFSLKWTKAESMEGNPHQFLITVTSPGKMPLAIHTTDSYKMFSDLEPETKYTISVSTVFNNQCSKPVSTSIHTEPSLREVLSKIGLEEQYDNKLTLSTILEINKDDTSENKLQSAKSLPGAFLKKLKVLNANARSVKCVLYDADADKNNAINPLDLITALLLCSDAFLQQSIVLKMALCQFAIPLLLPNSETRQMTLMLWAMREIVQTFQSSQQALQKLNCEERIVYTDIPLVSFVRLGRTVLSKSLILNKLFSNTQQYHDRFYHRNMVCGDVPRKISDGLVEISWYLPCGNRTIDKFMEPLAVANLRGDIRAFDKQFSFLCQISAIVYIFCIESEIDYIKCLDGKEVKANVFLISSAVGKTFTLKRMMKFKDLKMADVSQKKKTDVELTKALQESISKTLEKCQNIVSVEHQADRARWCEILVDEDSDECKSARNNVEQITKHVTSISDFKDTQLPFQGNIWKAISWIETECWRMRKAGTQNPEVYKRSLKTKQKELKRKQQRFEMTAAGLSFLQGVATSEVQRCYFMKWLEIELDNLCRHHLSSLQDQYKMLLWESPIKTEKIDKIDKQISVCSVHLEHFFRECGQLYECVSYLPEYSRQRKTIEQLPGLYAQMLLDGFPLELVDGDAANIPTKWIHDVLTELHDLMHSNSKLKVITVIGAENVGKSTLLNAIFGVRFAVGKATCTKGAFTQLLNVNKDVRDEVGCDCIVLIDTEGLKPQQMVQEDHSHERDKEVASLGVALSDVTIVCVPGDDSSKKDVLKMVLQAFMRSKAVGNRPFCHFVHANMSVVERKKKDKELVEQLDEIIREDAAMKKANVMKISDVMEFDADTCSWYIPPLWRWSPPMAPVSVDYSETVYCLKKRLIEDLTNCKQRGDLTHFMSRIENYWKSV